jgi:arylformamidase
MSGWIDCSPPITPDLPVWPGDTSMSLERTLRLEDGASVNLGSIRSTVHLGAHADAPFHVRGDGLPIDRCPLEPFLGPALVLDLTGRFDVDSDSSHARRRVTPSMIGAIGGFERLADLRTRLERDRESGDGDGSIRVLLRTGTFFPAMRFGDDFASLHPELIDRLADERVVLIGIDTPSVDPFSSTTLEAHHRLADRGVFNLEGLFLDAVPTGTYDLVATPLRLVGLDASPVRALLRARDFGTS